MSYEECVQYYASILKAMKKKVPQDEIDKMHLIYGFMAANYEFSQNYDPKATTALLNIHNELKRRKMEKKNKKNSE
jgi:hypothetical protein